MFSAQKIKFPIKDFFSMCDQICRKLRMWWHLLKKSFMENFIFVQRLVVINKKFPSYVCTTKVSYIIYNVAGKHKWKQEILIKFPET